MKVGVLLFPQEGSDTRALPTREQVSEFTDHLFREADIAEEYGFDGLFIPETHSRTNYLFPSSLILLAALATRTSRIRLGTYILLLPLYNPMHVAEQVALLDNLSKGRFILGLGVGWNPLYYQMFNVPFKERNARFEEGLEVLTRAWEQDRFTFDGKYYHFEDVGLTPKPYQKPRPEIWLGAMYPKAIARAGRLGDAWCSDPFPLDPKTWHEQVETYRKSAIQHGKQPRIVLMRDGWVAPTRKEAEETYASLIIPEWQFYFRKGILSHHPDFKSESDITVERVREHLVMGTPEDCIKQLEKYEREFATDYMVMMLRLPSGPPRDRVLECMKLFGREVLPHFNK